VLRLFVTGTDTGVGKTRIAAALCVAYAAHGKRVAAMKPVASGCMQTRGGLRNEDAEALRAAMTVHAAYGDVNPYAFEPAIAPHIAAMEAGQADLIVLAMGERADMTGEAKSKADIHLPGVQEDLIRVMQATGKPVVVLLMAGRPMIFNWTAEHVPAILYTWWLGNQAGNAIADVLYGKYNPSGKLPVSFPREIGQIPIYYNHYNTGRPARNEEDVNYVSAYTDLLNSPRYAFGYGLSYTPISPQTLLWLIFTSVVWIGLLTAYVLSNAVNRVVELLDTISKQLTLTPQETKREG